MVGTHIIVGGGDHADIDMATGMGITEVMVMVTGTDMRPDEGLVMLPDIAVARDSPPTATSIEIEKMELGILVSDLQHVPLALATDLQLRHDLQRDLQIHQQEIVLLPGRLVLKQEADRRRNLPGQVHAKTMFTPIEMEMFIEETTVGVGNSAVAVNGVIQVTDKPAPVI